jgi:hypothetical protein
MTRDTRSQNIIHKMYKYTYPKGLKEALMRKYVNKILTEIDEKPAIALTLVLGKNHYTGNVVFLLAVLFLVEKTKANF